MTTELDQFSTGSSNWRKTLRQNNTRTLIVIGLFFLIYGALGVLVDMFIATSTYPDRDRQTEDECLTSMPYISVHHTEKERESGSCE